MCSVHGPAGCLHVYIKQALISQTCSPEDESAPVKEHFSWEENTLKKDAKAVFQTCQLSLSIATVSINTASQERNLLVNAAPTKPRGTSGKMVSKDNFIFDFRVY